MNEQEYIELHGNVFPVKEEIKKLGGYWDSRRKVWMIPKSQDMVARYLVANAPQKEEWEDE